MSASELQKALSDLLLSTSKTMEPRKAKRELKVPTRFGQHIKHSSVMKEEKELFSYKQALKASGAEKWLDAMQQELQIEKKSQTWSSVKTPYGKKKVRGN